MSQIRLDLASPPDREKLVVQLMIGTEQFAELNNEADSPKLEFYAKSDGQPWIVDLSDLMVALGDARKKLIAE